MEIHPKHNEYIQVLIQNFSPKAPFRTFQNIDLKLIYIYIVLFRCAEANLPTVYADVEYYLPWIQEVMTRYSGEPSIIPYTGPTQLPPGEGEYPSQPWNDGDLFQEYGYPHEDDWDFWSNFFQWWKNLAWEF